jgi:hypothetical protein
MSSVIIPYISSVWTVVLIRPRNRHDYVGDSDDGASVLRLAGATTSVACENGAGGRRVRMSQTRVGAHVGL